LSAEITVKFTKVIEDYHILSGMENLHEDPIRKGTIDSFVDRVQQGESFWIRPLLINHAAIVDQEQRKCIIEIITDYARAGNFYWAHFLFTACFTDLTKHPHCEEIMEQLTDSAALKDNLQQMVELIFQQLTNLPVPYRSRIIQTFIDHQLHSIDVEGPTKGTQFNSIGDGVRAVFDQYSSYMREDQCQKIQEL
jgi:hypothetical protein